MKKIARVCLFFVWTLGMSCSAVSCVVGATVSNYLKIVARSSTVAVYTAVSGDSEMASWYFDYETPLADVCEKEDKCGVSIEQRTNKQSCKDSIVTQMNGDEDQQDKELRKQALIQKYGVYYGSLLAAGKLELEMTREMCREVIDVTVYDIEKRLIYGHVIESWIFSKEKQEMQVLGAMSECESVEEALFMALLLEMTNSFVGEIVPKYTVLVFTDGRLTSMS